MAEHIPEEELNTAKYPETSVMTGGTDRSRYLIYQLRLSIARAKQIDIIVSFLMESGVKMILRDLEAALDRGTGIRILTGNYLGITQPSALYLLKYKLKDRVDLRFYNDPGRSFHPKAYMFHYETDSEIYIGSSNISRSALTSGIEWNYCFRESTDPRNYHAFLQTFEDLFEHHAMIIDEKELKRYSDSWHKPAAAKDLEQYDEYSEDTKVRAIFEPRGAQIEALCALENSREQGANKGIVSAATGVGKTYLAAFDSKNYRHVLFVAHREEILRQAAESFRNVRNSEDYGFFNSEHKDCDKSVVFASVATLGRMEYLNEDYFPRDYFDYIVIDECHHSVNEQYRRITSYFQCQFLLGLTATPERLDGRNVYELCDYNVPYEITLADAINKGMLVPFRYYGIYDETDYSGLHLVRGRYSETELTQRYRGNQIRYEMIMKYYQKYGSRRALGFCCSREHAEDMARDFSKRGIPSVAVYSNANGDYSADRTEAIRKLNAGEIRVIFSVDMFNEGVDIPSVDMVMFLRPTESPTVFLQQLGRGLRKYRGKQYLTVLDFIGNYEKAGQVRFLLDGHGSKTGATGKDRPGQKYPDDCLVDFDMRLIDLFANMEKKKKRLSERIWSEYCRVESLLEKVPTRLELFTYMDQDIYDLCMRHSKENIFKHYMTFLYDHQRLGKELGNTYENISREFLNLLEMTSMSKVYKMPVLLAFYNNGRVRMELTENMLLESWKAFFSSGLNWKDLGVKTYQEYLNISDAEHLRNIKNNPVKFLIKSGKGFFVEKQGALIALREELRAFIRDPFFVEQVEDIIRYRTMDYYQRRYRET